MGIPINIRLHAAQYVLPAERSTGGARFGTNTFAPPMYEKRIGIFSTTTNQSTLMLPIMPASINTSALSAVSSSQWRFPVPLMYL